MRSRKDTADLRVSFEFFPPKDDAGEDVLWEAASRLSPFAPDFVSVTYGAGGSTRTRTRSVLKRLVQKSDLLPAAHLTCVGATCEEVDEVIRDFASLGVTRFVALRGDPPDGVGKAYAPHPGGYESSASLVASLKRIGDFDVSVSAYPEKHPESPDVDADIDMLKRKVDAGADRAITQFFFENDVFERYLEKVRKAGISIPIVPGILPVHNFAQVARFAAQCGTHVPDWLGESFEGLEKDPEARALVATGIAAEQVTDLARRGVEEFHFYTMNRASLVHTLCRTLGLQERQDTQGGIEMVESAA